MAEISVQAADGSRERYPLIKGRITIGRSRDSDIFLPDQWLSRQHAEIRQKNDGYYVSDLGSKNGTLLNGGRIHEEQRLRAGDIITLGEHILTFSLGEPGDQEEEPDSDPIGTRVFSARELSDIKTKPAIDATELARQNRVLGVLSRAAGSLVGTDPWTRPSSGPGSPLRGGARGARRHPPVAGRPSAAGHECRAQPADKPITGVSRSIALRVLEQRVSILLPNVMADAQLSHQVIILCAGSAPRSARPLLFTADSRAGRGHRAVYLDTGLHASSFSEDDLQIVTALANVAAARSRTSASSRRAWRSVRLEQDIRGQRRSRGAAPRRRAAGACYDWAGSKPAEPLRRRRYTLQPRSGPLLFARATRREGYGRRPPDVPCCGPRCAGTGAREAPRRRWCASTAPSARTSLKAEVHPVLPGAAGSSQRPARLRERGAPPAPLIRAGAG